MAHKYGGTQNSSRTLTAGQIVKKNLTGAAFSIGWILHPTKVRTFISENFFRPVPYQTSQTERDLLRKGRAFLVPTGEGEIHAWAWGDGPAVILVHGWNGRGIQFHHFIDPLLARGYSAVVFDGPGHGESYGRTSSYFQMTDSLRAVLKDQRVGDVCGLIGHSWGAGAIINALNKEERHLPSVWIAPALRLKEILEQAFSRHGIPDRIFRTLIREYEARYPYNLERDNPVRLLSGFTDDALIIHDTRDRVISHSDSAEVAAQRKGISLVSTHGLGHRRILNDSGVVEQTLDYIKNNARPMDHRR